MGGMWCVGSSSVSQAVVGIAALLLRSLAWLGKGLFQFAPAELSL